MVALAWHELISWALVIVSVTLFVAERRRNDNAKYYMVLQGILRACHQRAGFMASVVGGLRRSERAVSRDEFLFAIESEYVNYLALQEHIMGSMKSLQPDKDLPFDVGGFVRGAQTPQVSNVERTPAHELRGAPERS